MNFFKATKKMGCQAKQRFEMLMVDTIKLQEANFLNLLKQRGACFSLFALDSISHIWQPDVFRQQVHSNLISKNQRISDFYYCLLQKQFPKDTELLKKYLQLKWPSDSTFKINNKTVTVKEIGSKNLQGSYDRLFIDVPPDEPLDVKTMDPTEQDFKTSYQGTQLADLVKTIFTENHLHYKDEKFLLKFNDKLVQNYPPNVIFNYVTKSKDSQLRLEFIDLPSIYTVEDINMRKSLEELEQILRAANFLNLFTKIRFLREFQNICSKCSSNTEPVELPTGYLSILAQDPDLHSALKVRYTISKIWKACHENTHPQNYLVVLGDEYAGEVRDGIKKALNGEFKFTDKQDELIPIRKHLIESAAKLDTKDLGPFLKKSVLLEMLYESNTDQTMDMFKDLDQKIAKDYLDYLKEYDGKLELSALNPNGDEQIEKIFQEEPEACPGMELIFGTDQPYIENNYDPDMIMKIFQQIDTQIKNAENKQTPSGKIKPKIDNL